MDLTANSHVLTASPTNAIPSVGSVQMDVRVVDITAHSAGYVRSSYIYMLYTIMMQQLCDSVQGPCFDDTPTNMLHFALYTIYNNK